MKILSATALFLITCTSAALADPCTGTLSVSPTSLQYNANGAPLNTFTVTADPACAWFFLYQSGDSFILPQNQYLGSVTFDSLNPVLASPNHAARMLTEKFAVASTSPTPGVISATVTATQDPALTMTWNCPPAPNPSLVQCNGTLGVLFSSSVVATGGKPPYIYSTDQNHFPNSSSPDPNLPPGVTLNASSGAISGTPTAGGSYLSAIYVKDSDGAITGVAGYFLIDGACTYSIDGPANVPGLSQYAYGIHLPAGSVPTGITWSLDKPTASFTGPANQTSAIIAFTNTQPDVVSVKASFTLNGNSGCGMKQVALVKVDVGKPTFTNPGKAGVVGPGLSIFLVKPPGGTWVTTHNPGSEWAAFTYSGPLQAAEPETKVGSNAGGGGSAFRVTATVTLTSPAAMPQAHQRIEVGYIQGAYDSGWSSYHGPRRTVIVGPPTKPITSYDQTIDWLAKTTGPSGTDKWPWYDYNGIATQTGAGASPWNGILTMSDSPETLIPQTYNPNDPTDPVSKHILSKASYVTFFAIRMAAHTLDTDVVSVLSVPGAPVDTADQHYFAEAVSTWTAHFVWPVVKGASIVTPGTAWTIPGSPSQVNVNVVPSIIAGLSNTGFQRWRCASASCGP